MYGDCATSVNVFLTPGECWELSFRLSVLLSDVSCSVVSVTGTGLVQLKCEFGLRCVETKTSLTTEGSLVVVLHWTGKTTVVLHCSYTASLFPSS